MDSIKLAKSIRTLALCDEVRNLADEILMASRGGMRVLNTLDTDGPLSPSELAKKCQVSTARITVVLNSLVAKKLVERLKKKDDKRIVLLKLTEKGKKTVEEKKKQLFEMVTNLADGLTENEIEVFATLAAKIEAKNAAKSEKEKEEDAEAD